MIGEVDGIDIFSYKEDPQPREKAGMIGNREGVREERILPLLKRIGRQWPVGTSLQLQFRAAFGDSGDSLAKKCGLGGEEALQRKRELAAEYRPDFV